MRWQRGSGGAAARGAIVGLIFPPAFLASGAVGEAADHHEQKKEIKADVLPAGSSRIVALFEERWADDVDKALSNADKTTKHEVDPDRADKVKATASSEG